MSLLSFAKKLSGRAEKTSPKKATPSVAAVSAATPAPIAATGDLATRTKLRPLISEESVVMHGNVQTVVFRVHPTAAKRTIGAAVAERFGVKPTSVRTIQMSGKTRRRGRTAGSTPAWKKAYVTLPAGKTIDITA